MFLFSRFGFQRVGRFGCLLVRRCLRGWLVRRGRLYSFVGICWELETSTISANVKVCQS